ncbi:MAG: SDR family oxidoreductase [Flammeovirgaceae bacterium]
MTQIKGKTILVTGGASGIGKLMGKSCLEEGARRLIIWDINKALMLETVHEFRAQGYDVHAYQVDVSDVADIESAAYTVFEDIGFVDILFNNAGIVVGKEFSAHTHEDIKRTVDINTSGVMHVALEFLPEMLHRKRGHIINIASASSFVPNPKMSVYAASKWAVLGWSESLRLEMERGKTGVKILTVTPSYINTGMFDGVKSPLLTPILQPHEITEQIIKAIKADDILLRSPSIVNVAPILRGLLPTRLFDFVAEQMGVYDSMKGFKGHAPVVKKATPAPKRRTVNRKKATPKKEDLSNAKDENEPQKAVK